MGCARAPASHLNTPLYVYDLIRDPRDGMVVGRASLAP